MLKTLTILLLVVSLMTNLYSQKNSIKVLLAVPIDSNTRMLATEVTVQEWMYYLVNNDFDSSLFPDTNRLSGYSKYIFERLASADRLKYFKIVRNFGALQHNFGKNGIQTLNVIKSVNKQGSDSTINIPITGVTFNQVQQFCKWKETIINASKKTSLIVSLPSIETYKKVIPNRDSVNDQNCALFNWKNCNCLDQHKKGNKAQGKSLLRADSYWPTNLGLYNVQGNAAEMTNIEGIAMGGSFRHSARESYNDSTQNYSSAEDWLGFRYIITTR